MNRAQKRRELRYQRLLRRAKLREWQVVQDKVAYRAAKKAARAAAAAKRAQQGRA